jgi:hypothetical protein
MTDTEIIELAWRYYKAGRARTAEVDGIPTRDEWIASRLVLAIRIGQVEQHKPKPSGCDYVATHAKRVARPLFLKMAVDSVAGSTHDYSRATDLVDAAFVEGWRTLVSRAAG